MVLWNIICTFAKYKSANLRIIIKTGKIYKFTTMKKTYLEPSIEVVEVKIEKGFALSPDFGADNQAGQEMTDDEWVEF